MNYSGYIEWKKWSEENFGRVGPGTRFYFGQIFKRGLKKNSKILEIGFGNGEMLGYFRAKGHEIIGVELNDALMSRAKILGYTAYAGAVWDIPKLQTEKFDLIAAFSVVEHMYYDDLSAFFSWTRKHLNDGGKLYLRFPEGASPFGLAYQNGDFTHVTSLTKLKIEALCNKSDLDLMSYTDDLFSSNKLCSFGLPGKMVLLMLQWYARWLRWTMRVLLYPLQPELKLSSTSIAVITIAKATNVNIKEIGK